MKKIVYSILILAIAFLLNIGLYFYSENYNFFLKKLKYGNSIIDKQSENITDNYSFENNKQDCNCESVCQNINSGKILNIPEIITNTLDNTGQINELFKIFDKNKLFEKKYDEYYKIFGITDEYPTDYLTYNNENYELYLFLSGKFEDLYNLFEVLAKDGKLANKFTLNKVKLFGKNTFFINALEGNGNVRVIIDSGKILVGLNIKKSYYNNIKTILEKF
ncbi:MAG: hypothetical protein PHE25_04130 [Candidatus Gracilibacteria bacterium]|nr:hypothetical protein [Candidatus Gracilibacteria bacterium]